MTVAPPATPPATPPSRDLLLREVGRALTYSVELVMAMGIGLGLGWWAQERWPAIAPWGFIGGALLGAGAVMRSIWRILDEATTVRRPPARNGNGD